jgi:hypothetical protein
LAAHASGPASQDQSTVIAASSTEWITLASAAAVNSGPIPVDLLALLRYSEDGWSVRETPPANAILSVVENSINIRRDPAVALRAMSAMVATGRCITGTRGKAAEAAKLIRADWLTNA